jgi:hypothetical protein
MPPRCHWNPVAFPDNTWRCAPDPRHISEVDGEIPPDPGAACTVTVTAAQSLLLHPVVVSRARAKYVIVVVGAT